MTVYTLYDRGPNGEYENIDLFSSFEKALSEAIATLKREQPEFVEQLLAQGVQFGQKQDITFTTEDHTLVEYSEWGDGLYIHWGGNFHTTFLLRITDVLLNDEVETLLQRGN